MPFGEYEKRAAGLSELTSLAEYPNRVEMTVCEYDPETFIAVSEPFIGEPEGGLRCRVCFELRIGEAARSAKSGGFDYFASTLSVSPHKDAKLINDIGAGLAERFGVRYLRSDFKKRDGYRRSVELSRIYGLYRQDYCGCKFKVQE